MTGEPILTDVGCAALGDNLVRGRSVRDELFGRASRWSLLSSFLGGPALDAADAAFLEDVLVATVAPDPRIWPLKIGWIVGAYGDWWAAGAAVQGMLAECRMGPWACAAACPTAQVFARLEAESADGLGARALAWARAEWAAGGVVWGFGVAGGAGRAEDERLALIDRAARRHGRDERPHYRASIAAARAIAEATGRYPNMALGVAAIGLDLGLDRAQIEAVMYQVLEPQIVGNAFEAARLRPGSLREVPSGRVGYVGRSHRTSARRGSGASR